MPEYETFGRDYLLLHEILETLRKIGLTITATGSEADGYIPLYEFQVETASLHFGTLVGLLNNPERYKPEPGQIQYLSNLRTKRHEVSETRYSWDEVATAIETLVARNEVKKEIQGKEFLSADGKIIQLTKNGLASLNTKKYLKQYEKERNENITFHSTISTNLWMRIFTGVLAISALTGLIFQLPTCNKHKTEAPASIERSKCKQCGIDSIYILNDSLPHLRVEHNKESLKKK